jgi:hypothetical protein
MARRSLRPHLNQIRTWVRQGRTDAWIAHQLEVTVQQIESFKRENELAPAVDEDGAETAPVLVDEEIDLRAEDDAQIAAELEAAEARRAEEEAAKAAAEAEEAKARAERGEDPEPEPGEDGDADAAKRRRGRRGGRGRARRAPSSTTYEGTFDHGEEGYGLWLDPEVADNAVYAEHWAGHRPVEVTVEEDQIIIRRAGSDED